MSTSTLTPPPYPTIIQGGSRLETIGDIVYAGAMGSVSVVLIASLLIKHLSIFLPLLQAFSIQDLVRGSQIDHFHLPSVIVVAIAFRESRPLLPYTLTPLKNLSHQTAPLPLLLLRSIKELPSPRTLGRPVSTPLQCHSSLKTLR